MDNISLTDQDVAERVPRCRSRPPPGHRRRRWRALALVGVVAALAAVGGEQVWRAGEHPAAGRPRRRRSP